ncbi:MAG: hypothetical protein KME15_04880 [Drouetiella hepatica Uher 2000/2452]|jgi:hypothetical protein|uniref:Calcium-binding protein n=1 Tax=Drouetiella hepatica Uher 2000/2452 TaxID=904376 RepID=A0A951Q8U1_9CYAN|nr:hypothetical protein [Drouetiella hepatica Uher 2000/2452]
MQNDMPVENAPDLMPLPDQKEESEMPPDMDDSLPPEASENRIRIKTQRSGKGENRKEKHRHPGLGTEGNDVLTNNKGGKVKLKGGAGDDKLIGGKGKDLLVGGEGNDVLFGHRGPNILEGGAGSDIFVLNRGRGHNVVKDFNALEGDKLVLPQKLSFENLTFRQVGNHTSIQQGNRKVGLLLGVQASSITADIFVKPPVLANLSPLTTPAPV